MYFKPTICSVAFFTSILSAGGDILPIKMQFDVAHKENKSMAADVDKFMFIGISTSINQISFKGLGTDKSATLGLRYGIQSKVARTLIEAKKNFQGLKEFTLETDLMFNPVEINRVLVKPYVGASIGYFNHKYNNDGHAMFGIHFGTLVNINNDFDLDVSYVLKDKRDSSDMRSYKGVSMALHYYF